MSGTSGTPSPSRSRATCRGGGLVAFIQGALSAIALFFLGAPYALLLGTWVSITSIIPYLGAVLGAIPAVLLALFESTTTALLTALAFLLIQQLEGNVLTPRIQGQTLRVPSILIFLAVIAGGEIAGLLGVIFAVPTVAVLRVLFDFFRVRLRTRSQ
jgi:predicted PurR-regulated permease PerM